MAMKDILSKDFLGYTCVEEKDLDHAFLLSSKYGPVPQTCFKPGVSKTVEVVSEYLGHEPTEKEWSIFTYRWCKYHEVENCGWDYPEVSNVPLPDSLGFMIGMLCIFTIVKLFKNMDDMENIR